MARCGAGSEPLVSRVDAAGGAVSRECAACRPNTFNFDGAACHPCPAGADCPGGAAVLSRPGWWRSSESAEAGNNTETIHTTVRLCRRPPIT